MLAHPHPTLSLSELSEGEGLWQGEGVYDRSSVFMNSPG
jgi:hypothetical protein